MKKSQTIVIALGIIVIIAVGAVLYLLKSVLIPLTFAVLLSLMLNPLVKQLNRIRIPRWLGILIVLGALALFFGVLGRVFYSSILSFAEVYKNYLERLTNILQSVWTRFKIPEDLFPRFQWTQSFIDNSISNAIQVTGSFVSFGSKLALFILFLVFMLIEIPMFKRKIYRALSRNHSKTVTRAVNDTASQISKYLLVKTIISTITGFLVWMVLKLIGQDLALLWGILAFLLNYIPNIGSALVMVGTMLLGLAQFYPAWDKIFLVWVGVPAVQVVMGNIIDPALQGDQLDLSPLVILLSLVIWGWLWGIAGMFLSVPLTVAMRIVFFHSADLEPVAIMMGSGRTGHGIIKRIGQRIKTLWHREKETES